MSAGGKEVGRVSIRVVPNTDNFRREVEEEAAKLRDLKVNVKADLDSEQAKAEAERLEKELKPTVKADIDTSELRRKFYTATRELRAAVTVAAKLDTTKLKAQMARLRALTRKNIDVHVVAKYSGFFDTIKDLRRGISKHLGNIRMGVNQTWLVRTARRAARKARAVAQASLEEVSLQARVSTAWVVASAREAKAKAEAVLRNVRAGITWSGKQALAGARATHRKLQSVFSRVDAKLGLSDSLVVRAARAARAKAQAAFGRVRAEVELVTAPMLAAARAARKKAQALVRGIKSRVDAKFDLDSAGLAVKARAAAKAASAGLKVVARLDVDRKSLAGVMAGVGKSARFLSRPLYKMFGAQVFEDVIRNFTRVKGIIAAVTLAASAALIPIAAIGTAAGSAVKSMFKLFGGMMPAAFGAAALGIAGIVKSFAGFGAVIKATNTAELEEAIAGLGPAAQRGALGVFALTQAFSEASAGAQEAFWSQISDGLAGMAPLAALAGAAVEEVSRRAGAAANSMIEFFNTTTGASAFTQLLNSAADAAGSIAEVLFGVIPGLTAVGAAAGPVFASLANSLRESFEGWSDRMIEDFDSGALQARVEAQVEQVKNFFAVLGDLGGIIGSVWGAAAAEGERFMGPMRETIAGTREWLESSAGVAALESYFGKIGDVVATFTPIFQEIAHTILGVVIPAMADFLNAAGPGMQAFAQGFADVIAQLAPFATVIGEAFGAIVGKIGEILPSIVPLVPAILGVAAAFEGWKLFGGFLQPLIGLFGGLSAPLLLVVGAVAGLAAAFATTPGAMDALGSALQSLMGALQPVGQLLLDFGKSVWESLQPAFQAMIPVVLQFIETLAQIISAVTPVIGTILEFASSLIAALVPVFVSLMPVVQSFVSIVGSIVVALAPVLNIVLRVAVAFAQLLVSVVSFVASALGSILSFVAAVVAGFASMAATVIATVAGWVSSLIGFITDLVGSFTAKAQEVWTNTVAAFSEGASQAILIVSRLPQAAKEGMGAVGRVLWDSGKALIKGFIDGILSMVGAVKNAAGRVVQAARDFFPFSPAKEGPFSGRGYTTFSGKALVKDFAGGMTSEVGGVRRAAEGVVKAAHQPFEDLARDAVLQPVLESNAKKIHAARKKEREAEEKHLKRLEEIRKDGKNSGEKVAKENEKYAETLAKIRKDLDESLEAPDYSRVDRSFNAMYVEGSKELLRRKLMEAVRSEELASQARSGALVAVAKAREVFGDHPLISEVEINVKSEHFESSFYKAIEDAGLSAVPVEFVISNLDQLKSDLGMGDGVISRAIDQAMEWNWNNSDANRYREESKQEVHYHVEDMQEAIRLENLRVRKQMMKIN